LQKAIFEKNLQKSEKKRHEFGAVAPGVGEDSPERSF